MTIIAIGWRRGNKKALATILPTEYWDRLRALPKFDYYDIAAALVSVYVVDGILADPPGISPT